MTKALTKKKLIITIAGLLLLTFCIPASSHAAGVILVPAAGLAIWGVTLVASGVAAMLNGDESRDKEARTRQEPAAERRAAGSDLHEGAPPPQRVEG